MISAMTQNVWTVLSPLLIINYVFGLKIMEFPIGHPRLLFGLLYILLLWSFYYFIVWHVTRSFMQFFPDAILIFVYQSLNYSTVSLSIVLGIYYNKKFRNCLKKLVAVDITLEKLGITTNYQQLHRRIVWLVLGWFAIAILIDYMHILYVRYHFKYNTITATYTTFIINYCNHVTLISDLTLISILGYVGVKFDQINKHLQDIANNDNRNIKQAWENPMLHSSQCRLLKNSNNKLIIWTITHLHLELCKIFREIDCMYAVEMTIKMGTYFGFLAANLSHFFDIILFKKDIINFDNILNTSLNLIWLFHNILKLVTINYVCEKVSAKANSTKNFVDKVSSSCNVEMYENISQLLLQLTQSPLRFYGLGLFQFGFKFLQKFISSVMTVVVLLLQSHIDNKPC